MEVCVGHVVVPHNLAQPLIKPTGANEDDAQESSRKKQRVESAPQSCAPPADVVMVQALTEESMREALRSYAMQALDRSGQDISREVAEQTREWCRASSATWPIVVLPPPQQQPSASSSGAWTTSSFCFVPQVLNSAAQRTFAAGSRHEEDTPHVHSSASQAALACVDKRVREVLAAIPLPRGVCIAQGNNMASSDGCITAVLCERITLPSETPADAEGAPPASSPSHRLPAALTSKPLLLVGAGGIGCEVLKVLVLSGFTHIHVIDLDTIDATNLNRQFLFQLPDVGHSKAETARRVVLEWFQSRHDGRSSSGSQEGNGAAAAVPHIAASHDNIKADIFDDAFYRSFAVVLNALDNVSARQHVNRLCMRNAIPLIESGTMGYNGQVQPIVKGVYECYDCRPKPPDTKTFAVCTIHARPTTMVHCVHYAKELYEVLFGSSSAAGNGAPASATAPEKAQDDDEQQQQQQPSDGGELSYLRAMVAEWRQRSLPPQKSSPSASYPSVYAQGENATLPAQLGAQLLRHLFVDKVNELLAMKSAWSSLPPVPLDAAAVQGVIAANATAVTQRPLSPEEVLSVADCMELFLRAVEDCLTRTPGLAFRKEDDVAVRFVSATANLRAAVFHITQQSLEEVRSIAGSIVPAIATTNAIIAAAVVHELVTLLRFSSTKASDGEEKEGAASHPLALQGPCVIYARRAPQTRRRRLPMQVGAHALSPSLFTAVGTAESDAMGIESALKTFTAGGKALMRGTAPSLLGKPRFVTDAYLVHSTCPNPPNTLHCLVCQDVHPEVVVRLSLDAVSLGQLVHRVLEAAMNLEAPCVCHGTTLLYEDDDYESLASCSLAELLCPASSSATPATRPHRFVITADALNTEVAWNIVLIDATASTEPQPSCPSNGAAANEQEDGLVFSLSGLEAARAAERRAVARLTEQRSRDEEERQEHAAAVAEAKAEIGTSAAVTVAGGESAAVVISDDDEVSEVIRAAEEATAETVPHETEAGNGTEEDEVVVVD